MTVFKFLKRIYSRNHWVVRKCGWPFKPGYATYNPKRRMILDTGLSKEQAQQLCAELNKKA